MLLMLLLLLLMLLLLQLLWAGQCRGQRGDASMAVMDELRLRREALSEQGNGSLVVGVHRLELVDARDGGLLAPAH
jgi:hypothetical protein